MPQIVANTTSAASSRARGRAILNKSSGFMRSEALLSAPKVDTALTLPFYVNIMLLPLGRNLIYHLLPRLDHASDVGFAEQHILRLV